MILRLTSSFSVFRLTKYKTRSRLYNNLSSATSFDDGKSPYYITTPIYYVNDKPHIGHAYTSIACDVMARYMRLCERDVFFLSGTDEHGQKVEKAASISETDPQTFVDGASRNFVDLLDMLNISNDKFIRTTDGYHKQCAQKIWNQLVNSGDIYLGSYEGWYSVRDECYYTESELVDGKAPTGAEVSWVTKEPSYFFRLEKYQDLLLQYYEDHPDFIAPSTRRNEAISFVKGGLRDLSISRTSFEWGVPVPNDDGHIMYVWLDALVNYLSAIGYGEPEKKDTFDKYWHNTVIHVVGKDILRFHAVYWPAFLMAANLNLPKRIFAHGWWTKDGEKISKSVGNVIDPIELVKKYGVDQTRFFLMAEVTFGNDGDFSYDSFVRRVNTNLANELGNLNQRTLSMVYKNCNKAIPLKGTFTTEDKTLLQSLKLLQSKTACAVAEQALHKYTDIMISAVWDINKYIDDMAPWVLKKSNPDRMNDVLFVLVEAIRIVSILYQPLIPTSANNILDQLKIPKDERTFKHLDSAIVEGIPIDKPVAVFPRIESDVLQEA